MKRISLIALLVLLLAFALTLAFVCRRPEARVQGPLPHDVYVWQRVWNSGLNEAILQHSSAFTEVVVLSAEVTWRKQQPHATRAALDYETLRRAGCRVGLALRIGSFAGPFRSDAEQTRRLTELAALLVEEAAANQISISELQLDFDCAESKLDGYRTWIESIRRRVSPVPVTITALPSWLNQSAFKRLIAATDGYVLQVHSLARPEHAAAPFTLCDSKQARRAVDQAARLHKPFRVALPTYGYHVAFDRNGSFIGIAAEGPEKLWPAGTQIREIRADPQSIADLVSSWTTDRPQSLTGVIWYRLPVPNDTLNWSWPTLSAVMNGRLPQAQLQIETRQEDPELVEVDLINIGNDDFNQSLALSLNWRHGTLVAADGLHGIELVETTKQSVALRSGSIPLRIRAGQRCTLGWIRLDQPAEVSIEFQ